MNLPKDPVILLSFVNTKLRDEYHSLEELCEELGVEKDRLVGLLGEIDYEYDKTSNRFVQSKLHLRLYTKTINCYNESTR